jgi:tripartite-type tricarboxylate transporter receptor subunit TctC
MNESGLFVRLAALAALFVVAIGPVAAQTFPSRLVKLVVPQTPGGATDVFARKIGQALSERWGQTVIVENRAGAAGTVGTDFVAKSPADGYTLLVTYAGSQAINPSLYARLPFDSVKDFQPIATLAVTPFFLIVGPKVPANDLREFIALARAQPEVLTYASSGNGSVNHLLGEMLKAEAGVKILHVPSFSSVPSVLPIIQGGQVRALAVSSAKRVAAARDVPTIAEAGFPGFDVNPWWGILAPAGIDAAIARKINNDVGEILRSKEMVDFLATQGAEPLITSPHEFLALLKADIENWAKVVKAAGVTLN